jgi:hypothetical protein
MKRTICLWLSALLLFGCIKDKPMAQLSATWHDVTQSQTGADEGARLAHFVEQVRANKLRFTLSIANAKGEPVPASAWRQRSGEQLTISLRFDGNGTVYHWQPKDVENIVILLRE